VIKEKSKLFLLILIIILIGTFYFSGFYEYLKFETIKNNLEKIQDYRDAHPYVSFFIFMGCYILITSLSIPGAIVLTVLAGAIFGVWAGTLFVGLASSIGALIAFLMSRYLFRDFVMKHFSERFRKINSKFKEDGISYLFTLRLIPVSPYVVINLLMGLTDINVWSYFWITFVAMLPGTFLYVYAGLKLSEMQSPSEILTWPIVILLTLLGVLPYVFKKIVTFLPPRTNKV
jgi:uncharacterized membrane protein YdjX (TVP38/TMEM64 family)